MYQIKNEAIRIHSSMPNVSAQNNVVEKCFINKRGLRSKGIMLSSYTNDPLNENKSPAVVNDFIVKESTIIGGDHGIILFNVKNGLIEGNQCIASVERGIILSPTVSNVIISENIVDSAGSTGIHLAYNAKDITIQKNRVTNSLMDMSGRGFEGQGIKAYAGFNNIRIIDNVCIGNATDGIALEGGGEGSNFLISGNLLENNKRNGIRVWAGEISICKGGDITFGTIGDNRIEGNLEEPIFIGSDNYGKNKVRKTKVLADNKLVPAKGKLKVKQEYSAPSNKVYRGS
jgi:parallel beta-helix repeat protein